jgi:hypothetical protein
MNSTPIKSLLLVLCIGFAALLAPRDAGADYKTSTGTACMPYGSNTEWSDLLYLSGGVTTRGDADASILCSFVVDADNGSYDATLSTDLQLYFKAGATDAAIVCTATAGSGFMDGVLTYSQSLDLPATLSDTVSIDGVQAPPTYSWAPLTVNCTLPAHSTLARLVMSEHADTDT